MNECADDPDRPMTMEEAHDVFYVGSSYVRKVTRRGEPDREENCTFDLNRMLLLVDGQYKQIEALKSDRLAAELKAAAILEGERRQFHHDVLCIMLKEITRAKAAAGCMNINGDTVFQQAKAMADLAYPPPKAEP